MAADAPLRPAILIPTYNNARTVAAVIEAALRQLPDVLVVNDGSTDATADVLAGFDGRILRFDHEVNRGKGKALRNGFRILGEAGFSHAITLDADGQLFAEDVPRFLEAMGSAPGALVVGQRDLEAVGAPWRSRLGLWFSNRALRILCGARLEDTQTGFRAYPLAAMNAIAFEGERFDFEMEVLVKAAWNGIPLLPIPIRVSYAPEGGRVSHFRPVRDFMNIARLSWRLFRGRGRGRGYRL
jgi:glycosyltransferase involved in cell wall biosynthesis